MIRALALLAMTGCFGVQGFDAEWQPIDEITGEMAVEVGPQPLAALPPARGALRVVTWNAHFAEDPVARARALAGSSITAEADVILLQEVEAYPGEPATRTRRIAEALGMTWVYAPARRAGDGTHGIAFLSRYPIGNLRIMQMPRGEAAFRERDRVSLAADIDVAGRSVTVINVHLDVRINAVDRIRQLHPAVIDLPQPPEQVVVGGDFNTNPWAWVGSAVPLTGHDALIDQDQAAVIDDYLIGLGFASPIAPDQATFKVPLLGARLDNIYVRGMAIAAAGVATDVDGSDHWPVYTDLVLSAAP